METHPQAPKLKLRLGVRKSNGACVEPCIYYANTSSILRFPVHASTGKPQAGTPVEIIYSHGTHIGPIALDHRGERVFWCDIVASKINRAFLNGSNVKTVINYGVSFCEGIAYDWSTDNLYWTDALHNWIEVSDAEGQNRMVLLQGGMQEPRGIAVTPIDGYIFWTDWGSSPRIERSTLDGKERRQIVKTNLIWPNDLAIDFSIKRIYCVDARTKQIWSIDYSGNNRRLHSHHGNVYVHPYSITTFAEYSLVYFTDWATNSVKYQILGSGSPQTAVEGSASVNTIGQVRLFHSSNQPPASSQCRENTNLCSSHLCLKKGESDYMCACPTGTRPSNLGSQECKKAERDYEIFLAASMNKSSKIFHISKFINQSQHHIDVLKLPQPGEPMDVAFDPANNTVYWTDASAKRIMKMCVNGSGFKVLVDRSLTTPDGIAIDPYSRLLYFANQEGKSIEVVKIGESVGKKIVSSGLEKPRDVLLHHEKGLMFFSDWGSVPKIESAYMDGTGRRVVVSQEILYPGSLVIDKVEQRLYWSDTGLHRIESSNFNGSNRRILHVGKSAPTLIAYIGKEIRTPYGLAIHGSQIYWTDERSRGLFSSDKRIGGEINLITRFLEKPSQVIIYSNKTKKELKKVFTFSHAQICLQTCRVTVSEQPALCPPGYKQTRLNTTCANCTTKFGPNSIRCPCNTNWMTCAHRVYQKSGCTTNAPFIKFTVRECVQVVNPGYCPASNNCPVGEPNKNTCSSDGDCRDSQKCCNTTCGVKCLNSLKRPALHPCEKQNGGCNRFCFRLPNGYTCGCPDTLLLQPADNKTCIYKTGYCAQNKPCQNNGVCSDDSTAVGGYKCRCMAGFTGRNCATFTGCSTDYCKNGGQCISGKGILGLKCKCTNGYTGSRCETTIDHCVGNICTNGATCLHLTNGYMCQCAADYTGARCDVNIDNCAGIFCQNSGTCQDGVQSYKCNCVGSFTGSLCHLSYGNNLVQVNLTTSLQKLPAVKEIKKKLAQEYTSYCAINNCADTTSSLTRKKRESPTRFTVSSDNIVIPTGFPKSTESSKSELRYAVVGKMADGEMVVSSKITFIGPLDQTSQTTPTKPPAPTKQPTPPQLGFIIGFTITAFIIFIAAPVGIFLYRRKQRQPIARDEIVVVHMNGGRRVAGEEPVAGEEVVAGDMNLQVRVPVEHNDNGLIIQNPAND
eukprot:gene13760-15199_t